jgi:hypothetical protein
MLETLIYEVDATPGLKSKRTEKLFPCKHVEKKALQTIKSQCYLLKLYGVTNIVHPVICVHRFINASFHVVLDIVLECHDN